MRTLPLLVLTGVHLWAAGSVGLVLSTGPVLINGTQMYAPGVVTWPVLHGDEITTTSSDALLLFRDRSRVFLGRKCRVKLEKTSDHVDVRILEGALWFTFAPSTHMSIHVLEQILTSRQGSHGSISLDGTKPHIAFNVSAPACRWSPEALLQRLTWVWGVYLPAPDPQTEN